MTPTFSRLAIALALAVAASGCTGEDASEEAPAADAPRGQAARVVAEGCVPAEEAQRYQPLVGDRAFAVLRWTGMKEEAANLRIPVYVVSIEQGAVGVRILQIPMREQYILVWLQSGHIEAAGDNLFLLDPCSAALAPWSEAGSPAAD